MIDLPFTHTELMLLKQALEAAENAGWPADKDDKFRASMLKKHIEKGIATLQKDRWQGFNK